MTKIDFQVPGRLGLLVTIYLIASNVYNQVDAPMRRGFSRIDIWMFGVQVQILLAIAEYGILLAMQKIGHANNWWFTTLDKWTFLVSLFYFILFNVMYWAF